MSLLKSIIQPQNATGDVKSIYEMSKQRFGYVPNAIQMQSINPDTIMFYAGLSKYFVQSLNLSEKFRLITNEIIANKDQCEYCISLMQGAIANNYGISKEELNEIVKNPSLAPFEENEKALLEFILKVLDDSNSTLKEDIEKLTAVGWSEKDIFDAINFATQMQKMHIMLNAFKIEND